MTRRQGAPVPSTGYVDQASTKVQHFLMPEVRRIIWCVSICRTRIPIPTARLRATTTPGSPAPWHYLPAGPPLLSTPRLFCLSNARPATAQSRCRGGWVVFETGATTFPIVHHQPCALCASTDRKARRSALSLIISATCSRIALARVFADDSVIAERTDITATTCSLPMHTTLGV
jgi:hypothetical protein